MLMLPLIVVGGKIFICAAAASLIALAVAWKFATFATGKIGGVTGDIYGAVSMLAELSALITFLLTAVSLR